MGRRRGVMSEGFKQELAKELGFYDKVKDGDWGNITTREAGLLVRRAIEKAEEQLRGRTGAPEGREGGAR
ncbi:MAG: small, acid-soluble spore protein, alpha/beta type [Brockia lithotrophica]|nr:small, acid-soluble spore protein, alpha/beta type [Brockia lithotrophica]